MYVPSMSSCLTVGCFSQLSVFFSQGFHIKEIIDTRFLLEGIPARLLAVPCKLQCRRKVQQYEVPKKRKYRRSSQIVIGAKT